MTPMLCDRASRRWAALKSRDQQAAPFFKTPHVAQLRPSDGRCCALTACLGWLFREMFLRKFLHMIWENLPL